MKAGRLLFCFLVCAHLKLWVASASCVIQKESGNTNSDDLQPGSANHVVCTSVVGDQSFVTSEKKEPSTQEQLDSMESYIIPRNEEPEAIFYGPERSELYNKHGQTDELQQDWDLNKKVEGQDMMRFGRSSENDGMGHKFMRFGRGGGDMGHNFMRFGRGGSDDMGHKFMRFGRGGSDEMGHKFMRFGRSDGREIKKSHNFMRFGRSPVYGSGATLALDKDNESFLDGGDTNDDFDIIASIPADEHDGKPVMFHRIAKDNYKHNFMRFGKRAMYPEEHGAQHSDHRKGHNFMRFGRIPEHTFMRFGRK